MPYNREISNSARLSTMGAIYNSGLSYWSGSDPASYWPMISSDILNNQLPPSYRYRGTIEDRLGQADLPQSNGVPVSEWTMASQSIYGKILGTPNGYPHSTNLPDFSVSPESPDVTATETQNPANYPPGARMPEQSAPPNSRDANTVSSPQTPAFSFGNIFGNPVQFGGNLIVIVIAILLLGVAAYSIVIPREARTAIVKSAIAAGE